MQIWREVNNGSGVYTKITGTKLFFSAANTSNIYEHPIDPVLKVKAGDVLGIFGPNDVRLELYYAESYGPTNYYYGTGNAVSPPTGDFDTNTGGLTIVNDMPLVTVEFTPIDESLTASCTTNFASMDAITAGLQQTVMFEQQQQRLVPAINFTCHGFITKWILAARWTDTSNFPELQTWSSTDGTTYMKQRVTTFSPEGGSAEMTYYEHSPKPPHEFNDGDVLGVFIPDIPQQAIGFENTETGPLNYVDKLGNGVVSPPEGIFITSTTADATVNALPLIALEVSIPTTTTTTTTATATAASSPTTSDTTSATTSATTTAVPAAATSTTATDTAPTATATPSMVVFSSDGAVTTTSQYQSISRSQSTSTPVPSISPEPSEEPTQPDHESAASGSSSGVYIGAALGAVVSIAIAVILVILVIVLVFRKRRTARYSPKMDEDLQMNEAYGMAQTDEKGVDSDGLMIYNPQYGVIPEHQLMESEEHVYSDIHVYDYLDGPLESAAENMQD